MIESGVLTEQDRCELIRGEVVEKMTSGKKHAACVKRLTRLFVRLVGDHAVVGVQDPVEAIDSCPEPDIALLRPQDDFYSDAVPQPSDVLLLIEVADTSLEYDRTEKLSLYAEAGDYEYWIANLNNESVEVYRNPQSNGTYADARVLNLGETLDIAALPGVSVPVDQVFKARRDG
jgi:Uma2 family endonuclease